MDIWGKYKSPFGYEIGDNGIDSYGVDHSGFSISDEINYQTARDNRENQMMQMYNQQGITENYPQYTTNFWGDSGNNYGFGSSDISSNISAHPALNATLVPITKTPTSWRSNVPQQQIQNIVQQPIQEQNPLQQVVGAFGDMVTEYYKMKNHGYKYLDDYHHCKANYNAATRGHLGHNTAKYLGNAKETFDFYWNQLYKGKSLQEAIADKNHDLGVNAVGRQRGDSGLYDNAQEACADYRLKNPSFPKKYW